MNWRLRVKPDDPKKAPRIAELAGDYEFVNELGRDGRTITWLARERELGRDVAITVGGRGGGAPLRRLRQEATALGRLQHPAIVPLYGVRRVGRGLALILQHTPGPSVRELLRAPELPDLATVHRILRRTAEALAHAHARGVVHAGLTPDSIVVDRAGDAVLTGFGHASVDGEAAPVAKKRGRRRRTGYEPPEPGASDEPSERGDLYSLARVGYELLTGIAPVVRRQDEQNVPLLPLALARPDVPEPLRAAIDGALRDDPAERWPDARAFVDALDGRIPARSFAGARSRPGAAARSGIEALRGLDAPAWLKSLPAMSGLGALRGPAGNAGRRPSARAAVGALRRLEAKHLQQAAAALALLMVAGVLAAAVLPWAEGAEQIAVPAAADPALLLSETAEDRTGAAAAQGATGNASAAALAYALFGDVQEGVAGDTLPEQLVLRVEDTAGRAVAGAAVRFRITMGDGTLAADSVVTDEFGLASTWWLPRSPGMHEVDATVLQLNRGATFRARVLAADGGGADREAAGSRTASASPAGSGAGRPAAAAALVAVRGGFALGGTHSCLMRASGEAYCWGGNDSGQLGDGGRARRTTPAALTAGEPLAMLAAGVSHSCAVARSGLLYCWGGNSAGQLGDGSTTDRPSAVRVAGSRRYQAVAAGLAHSCALAAGGEAYCWGGNDHGQLGDGSTSARSRPVRAGRGTYRSLAVGWSHSCALTAAGEAYCWGRNASGELGDGSTADRSEPVAVSGGHRFAALAAGSHHTCGLREDGIVLCWGQNSHGQLGTGDTDPTLEPRAVAGGARYAALALGGVHGCAVTREGAAHCWGRNTYGQLGDGSTADRPVPAPVQGGIRFASVHASGAHSCGRTIDGRDLCWGYNADGQLGTGTRTNQSRPALVAAGW